MPDLGGRATGIGPEPQTRSPWMAALLAALGDETPLPKGPTPPIGPTIRAPTWRERIAQPVRRAYGAVAEQPIGRIADALGLSDFGGIARGEQPEVQGTAVIPFGTPGKGRVTGGATHLDALADAAVAARSSAGDVVARAKALYLQRGGGNSPVRMAQALKDAGYRFGPMRKADEKRAANALVDRLMGEAETTSRMSPESPFAK